MNETVETVSRYFKPFLIAVTTITVFAGCGGNPLNRESDPLKNYKTLKKDLPKDEVKIPGGLNCPAPYSSLTITNDRGDLVDGELTFPAGQKTTYQIHVQSETRSSVELVLTKQPAGLGFDGGNSACTAQIKANADGVKEGICELTYQPTKNANKSVTNFLLHSEVGKKECDDRDERKSFAVRIDAATGTGSSGAASLQKVDGFTAGKIYGKSEKISFTVVTADPNIQDSETAVAPQFEFVDLNPGNKVPFISAKNAITCGSPGKKANKTFQFSCTLDFSKVTGVPATGLARTSFDIFAQSVSGDQSSRFGVSLTMSAEVTP